MKVFATYDESGNIICIAIPAADVKDGEFDLVAEPGQYASQIEVTHMKKKQPHEVIVDLLQNYRVQRLSNPAKFVKITPPSDK